MKSFITLYLQRQFCNSLLTAVYRIKLYWGLKGRFGTLDQNAEAMFPLPICRRLCLLSLYAGARPATLRRLPDAYGWIDRWFDLGDIRLVDSLSELCPYANTTFERQQMTFDSSIVNDVQRPPFVNANTVLICGFYQSWKYVYAVEDELRRRFAGSRISLPQFVGKVSPLLQCIISVGLS